MNYMYDTLNTWLKEAAHFFQIISLESRTLNQKKKKKEEKNIFSHISLEFVLT